jgi:hypothetical protein
VACHCVPGEPRHAIAGELEIGVPGGVARVVEPGAVEGEAAELDDGRGAGPVCVDLGDISLAVQEDIGVRVGQVSGLDEVQESM